MFPDWMLKLLKELAKFIGKTGTSFAPKISRPYLSRPPRAGNPNWRRRVSTVDLLVLTSLDQLLFWKYFSPYYKTSYLNEEVDCTEPSPSLSVPRLGGYDANINYPKGSFTHATWVQQFCWAMRFQQKIFLSFKIPSTSQETLTRYSLDKYLLFARLWKYHLKVYLHLSPISHWVSTFS
jgi:hypothetical protein